MEVSPTCRKQIEGRELFLLKMAHKVVVSTFKLLRTEGERIVTLPSMFVLEMSSWSRFPLHVLNFYLYLTSSRMHNEDISLCEIAAMSNFFLYFIYARVAYYKPPYQKVVIEWSHWWFPSPPIYMTRKSNGQS